MLLAGQILGDSQIWVLMFKPMAFPKALLQVHRQQINAIANAVSPSDQRTKAKSDDLLKMLQ